MVIETALTASLLMSLQAAPPATAPEAPPAPETIVVTETFGVDQEAQAAPSAQEEPDLAQADEEKIICRRTAILGSRFKKRMCGTKREWETLRTKGKDTTRTMQRSGRGLDPNAG